jgi:signal transduction histidine kinase/ligand-binding sensor domain-containing protein
VAAQRRYNGRCKSMKPSHIRSMSTWLRPLACLLLCGFAALPSRSNTQGMSLAQFNHKAWTMKDGAPMDAWAIAQTPEGWLWFGAPTGLYRFDGIQFEHVDLEGLDPRRPKAISMLYASDSGALWIGYVHGGATLLKDGQLTHFGEAQGLGRGTVLWLTEDKHGRIWASSGHGFWHYDGRAWTRVGSDWGFPDEYATALLVDQRGTLWVVGEHEIFFLEPQSQRFQPAGIDVEDVDSIGFIESPDGRAWYTDNAGIHALPAQSARAPRAAVSNSRSSLTDLIDRSGNVWRVSSGGGVRRFPFDLARSELRYENHPQTDSFAAKDGLTDTAAKTILEDREGNVWVTTGGGVDRFRPTNFHALASPVDELGGYALAPAENGGIWIGSECGLCSSPFEGLWKFDGRLQRISVPGIVSVTAVERDADGRLWLAGPEGVWRQEGDERFRKIAGLPEGTRGQDVAALTIDLAGHPWIAVTRATLFRHRNGNWERNANLTGLPDRRPSALERDRQGRLWIGYGGDGELFVIESDRVKRFAAAEGLDVGRIFALHVGAHTVVAGANRIAVLDNGRFHIITTPADPAVLEGVSGIQQAKNGDLWFSSFKGAVRIDSVDLVRALQSRTYAVHFELFDADDGFPGISQPGAGGRTIVEGSDGRLWFAGSLNIAVLDPANIRRNEIPPPVVIRAVTAAGRQYSAADALSLASGTRDLQVEYTAPSLSRPDRIHFRYRLDGLDAGWIEAGARRQAFYTNLDPGHYKFRVAAANESGIWNESGAAIEIVIPPTFVQTRAFALLCIAAALALLWFAYALRVRRLTANLRHRLEERVAERERIARELHDTLLQGVQGLILKFQNATEEIPPETPARQLMEDALNRADDVLIEGRDRVKDLRISPAAGPDLSQAIGAIGAELAKAQSNRFNLSVEGMPRSLDPMVREETIRIAHEALTNAFRHARATNIETEIIFHRAELRLRFRDDGCGIDAAILKEGRPDHWGLRGMRERAKKIRASFEVWSRQGAGTEIELRVPARIAYLRNGPRWNWWPRGTGRVENQRHD